MKSTDYHAPETLDACLEVLKTLPEASALAGGTDLIPRMKKRRFSRMAIVSLRRVEELCSWDTADTLTIGAMTRLARVAGDLQSGAFEALREAASLIGSRQIRNVATVGGNLCNAAPSADTAPALLSLNASAVIVSAQGERSLPLTDFFRAPGETVLGPGELLRSVTIPRPSRSTGSSYLRHTPRSRMDLAVAGVGVALTLEDEVIVQTRIGLGAVAPTPIRALQAEAALIGRAPGKGWLDDVAEAAAAECAPIDDQRASEAYRRHLVAGFLRGSGSFPVTTSTRSPGGG